MENDKMILDNESVSEKINNYFSQIVDSLGEEIPLNVLKKSNFTFDELAECVNYTLKNGKFPDSLIKC